MSVTTRVLEVDAQAGRRLTGSTLHFDCWRYFRLNWKNNPMQSSFPRGTGYQKPFELERTVCRTQSLEGRWRLFGIAASTTPDQPSTTQAGPPQPRSDSTTLAAPSASASAMAELKTEKVSSKKKRCQRQNRFPGIRVGAASETWSQLAGLTLSISSPLPN